MPATPPAPQPYPAGLNPFHQLPLPAARFEQPEAAAQAEVNGIADQLHRIESELTWSSSANFIDFNEHWYPRAEHIEKLDGLKKQILAAFNSRNIKYHIESEHIIDTLDVIDNLLERRPANLRRSAIHAVRTLSQVGFDATSYDFGSVSIGNTETRIATITNTGSGTISFQAGYPSVSSLTSPNPYQMAGSTCGNSLAPGQSCGLTVTFAPIVTGSPFGYIFVRIRESYDLFAANLYGTGSDDLITYPITVSTSGNGTVTSSPAGIDCGSDCSESYASGTQVVLTATPASGYTFSGWSGSCSGTSSTCTLSMTAAKSVGATFSAATTSYALTVSTTGSGTVTSSPSGISCGTDCSESYASSTQVVLTATPSSGYTFSGWGGACSGTSSTCTLSMTAAQSVSASFASSAAITTLITHYYQSILERPPEAGGLAYYQERIAAAQAAGQDVKQEFRGMAYSFLNSPEYLNRQTSNTAYITTLYVTFLQRNPEQGGLDYYLARLSGGEVRNVLVDNFVNSPEFAQFMTNLGL